jgi:hypothetical protein
MSIINIGAYSCKGLATEAVVGAEKRDGRASTSPVYVGYGPAFDQDGHCMQCVAYAADRQEAPDKSVDSLSDEQLAALYEQIKVCEGPYIGTSTA